ncbi:MAG: hypothetical protein LBH91_03170 [Prevotellaceae bacterium]|jgi:hypothetical protein|nr:hypothetical protein [Prevotellaceae bacterium]
METQLKVPKRGWQQELAKEAGCTAQTVILALHHGAAGKKADRVRRMYAEKYVKN